MDRTEITGHTRLTGLLGNPVSHSISPAMHNTAFSLLGLDYVYLGFQVDESTLKDAVIGLKTLGVRGFNLTMPNKNKILEYLDHLSPAAELIGAVNTVVNDNGILTGYNTDGIGFMRSVADAGYHITDKTVTLMGAGGAATAICAQAALDGVRKIHIFLRPTSRFFARTQRLAENISRTTTCEVFLHDTNDLAALKEALAESALLINATSVGMSPDTEASVISDPNLLPPGLIVSDIIYNPRETLLLRQARARGLNTFNGLYMLLYQGAEAFRLWTGQEMPTEIIKEKYFR